jgi:hypothetical protein
MLDAKKLAKTNETRVLSRLSENGRQTAIATAMGTSESTVSRMKGDSLAQFCELLAHAGLKIVPVELRSYQPSEIDALLVFAKAHMASLNSSIDLADE